MIVFRGGALKQRLPLATISHPLRGDATSQWVDEYRTGSAIAPGSDFVLLVSCGSPSILRERKCKPHHHHHQRLEDQQRGGDHSADSTCFRQISLGWIHPPGAISSRSVLPITHAAMPKNGQMTKPRIPNTRMMTPRCGLMSTSAKIVGAQASCLPLRGYEQPGRQDACAPRK